MSTRMKKWEMDRLVEQVGGAPSRGVTVHTDHTNCPAGEDTKSRVYVTTEQDDSVLVYCHNCQRGGKLTKTGPRNYRTPAGAIADPLAKCAEARAIWDAASPMPHDCPGWWILQGYGLAPATIRNYGFRQGRDERFLIPIWQPAPNLGLIGFQARSYEKDPKPKYLTYHVMRGEPLIARLPASVPGPTAICEDVVSALKIRQAGHSAIAVLGSAGSSLVPEMLKTIGDFTVWFDNDNPTVIKNATALHGGLRLAGRNSKLLMGVRDPKYYTRKEIQECLKQ
jgi:hypothetical protein